MILRHYLRGKRGVTLVELIIAVALGSLLIISVSLLFSQVIKYFQSARVRQVLDLDAERTMNMITHQLQQARANSVVICACGSNPCYLPSPPNPPNTACTAPANVPPNSRIEFYSMESSATNIIYWNNNAVTLVVGSQAPQILAQNVSLLAFGGDAQDLSHLSVSLQLDAASATGHPQSVQLANQVIPLIPQ